MKELVHVHWRHSNYKVFLMRVRERRLQNFEITGGRASRGAYRSKIQPFRRRKLTRRGQGRFCLVPPQIRISWAQANF